MSECPICFEVMENDNNKIKTECGHEFHSNCFLTNVTHNGFNCPCCRKELAQIPCSCDMYDSDEEDDEYDDEDDEYDDDNLIEPPLYYILNKLEDILNKLEKRFCKQDILMTLINMWIRQTNTELLDLEKTIIAEFWNIISTFNALKKEEREIELMTMEDIKCDKINTIKLIDDVETIINTRVY